MTTSERERLLCYAAGILGSTIANPNYGQPDVQDWLINRSVRAANKLIGVIFDDAKLKEVLKDV